MDLPKKVVWITGASSGIGEALAYEFNKKEAKVILSARREGELERVKENCNNSDELVRIVPLDLADAKSLPGKTEEALKQFGTIDMLINNGGISQRAYAIDSTMETIRKIMEVNFFGSVGLTKALLPTFIEQQSGHIVVISSVMGKLGTRYRSAYAASKHALHGWFDCLRQEVFEHNIDVTLVCPGYIHTNVSYNALTGEGEKYAKTGDAHKKAMTPEEFASKLLPRLAKKKEEVYIGGTEILSIYVKQFFPKLLNRILRSVKVT